jgi:hypothetical protein
MTVPGGNSSFVLQLPTESEQTVGVSQFASIQDLKSNFSLISSARLSESLAGRGFKLVHRTTRALPASKAFWMGIFCAPEAHHRE